MRENRKVEFPKEMSARVADITDNLSSAYMKEAFVAAPLVIVAKSDENNVLGSRKDPRPMDIRRNIVLRHM